MKVSLYNTEGAVIAETWLRDDVFGVTANKAVVHQALVRQLANARQGNSDTKTRGEVAGSTKKLFRQKGTGRARQGSARAPHRRGGGVAFGPHPRSYRQAMPKKMRRLAIKAVLSARAAEGELKVVDQLDIPQPKTSEMLRILDVLDIKAPALIVTEKSNQGVILSARNIKRVRTTPAAVLNVVDLLSHHHILMTLGAVKEVERIWGGSAAEEGAEEN